MRCFRVDYATLGTVEKTPQGGVRVPATLTRTGVLEYTTTNGRKIREYRPPSEVSRADSLAGLRGAPLTLNHPPGSGKIGPHNFRQLSIGHVGDDVKLDGADVGATVYVQDAQAIRAIEGGRRELSCGYHCDVDETPGIVPMSDPVDGGKPYDRIQKGIIYNHLAFVEDGRAGNARLRLDSSENQLTGASMEKIEIIDGCEYTAGTDAHRQAGERRDARDKAAQSHLVKLEAERDDAKRRCDDATAKLAESEKTIKEQLSPANLDRLVTERAGIVTKASTIMGKEWKADGKANAQIMGEAVAKAHPHIRLDSKSAGYVEAAWDLLTSEEIRAKAERNDGLNKLIASTAPMPGNGTTAVVGPVNTMAQIRHDALVEASQRAYQPLALSKRSPAKALSNTPMLQSSQLETMK